MCRGFWFGNILLYCTSPSWCLLFLLLITFWLYWNLPVFNRYYWTLVLSGIVLAASFLQCLEHNLALLSPCILLVKWAIQEEKSLIDRIRKKKKSLWLAWALLTWHRDTFLLNQTWLNTCNRLWMPWCLTAPVSGFLHGSMIHYQLIHPWNWILKLSASTMLHCRHAGGK